MLSGKRTKSVTLGHHSVLTLVPAQPKGWGDWHDCLIGMIAYNRFNKPWVGLQEIGLLRYTLGREKQTEAPAFCCSRPYTRILRHVLIRCMHLYICAYIVISVHKHQTCVCRIYSCTNKCTETCMYV